MVSLRYLVMSIWSTVLFVFVCANASLYDNHPEVIDLTSSNWESQVMKSDDTWIVAFVAPWCGHCKALTAEYVKAAKALKGVVKLGAVNMDGPDQSVGAPYGVKGFPTIKVFGASKSAPTDYQSGRDANSIAQAALQAVGQTVQARLGGGGGGYGGGGGDSKVVELTDGNFEKKVIASKEPWLVAFVAPWCGHCKNLTPNWESAAREMDGKPVHIGRVDATANKGLGQKYKVEGFPTIKLFKGGSPEDYTGGRTSSDIVQFLENIVEASLPPPEVKQITSSETFAEYCTGGTLCLIAFFPGMVDSSAEKRNAQIEMMRKVAGRRSYKKFGFVWAEAGQQMELEKAFNVGDYPAVAAMSPKRLKWTTMRGAFSEKEIADFLGRLLNSQEAVAPFPGDKVPEIAEAQAWDGKDVEVEQEEEMSLDDIMNEELDEV